MRSFLRVVDIKLTTRNEHRTTKLILEEKSQIIYGRHPIADAMRAGRALEKIWVQSDLRGEAEVEIRNLAKQYGVPIGIVPKEKMNKMAQGGNHQGLMALAAFVAYKNISDIIPFVFEKGETPLILILDGITDVRNIGAIARSAEVLGVHAIVVPFANTALINGDAVKTSAGALNTISICREKSLSTTLDYLTQCGLQIVGSDLKAKKKLSEIDFLPPMVIVMGSEDEGISSGLMRKLNDRFIIPQLGVTDSLNVSVATGIILYEAQRQRGFER